MNLGYNHGSTGNLYDTEYDRSAELDDETEEQQVRNGLVEIFQVLELLRER